MSIHVPVLIGQQEQHKALRASLLKPSTSVESQQEKKIRTLEATVRSLRFELDKRDAEIRQLKTDVADRNARVLDQAHKLCELMRIHSDEEEYVEIRSVKDIVDEVLQDYPGITMAQIVSVRRTRELITPRHRCYYEVYRQRPDLSFPAIGRYFKRDHTSIISGVKKLRTGDER
ncbi:helix-turn-helix domain-containing protein [Rhizobium hidalgonense]|uniref:Helix-turn-helix domain-containing protein n=1 Tax=Rhizobium hidalgonense TaxID=1538159 RepID=A0AAJ2H1W2_9HYPH|nr:helix-turn-helix domain-containing protein [Rhizobium hidalgonense]MDR9777218.1 helix-turn-helix domain-containing protein [Rhizobium hidalgonense]